MLDLAILGLLEERDLHGYEIRRQLREHLGLLANVSFGSIYPALTRLEKAGAVVATEGGGRAAAGPPPPRPPRPARSAASWPCCGARRHSPARARRGKKVYRITEAGRQLFAELLAGGGAGATTPAASGCAWPSPAISPPRPAWRCWSGGGPCWSSASAEAEAARADLDVYARSVVQHTADGIARDISWLDTLIASERDALATAGTEPVA